MRWTIGLVLGALACGADGKGDDSAVARDSAATSTGATPTGATPGGTTPAGTTPTGTTPAGSTGVDSDDDGLTDAEEAALGTDPDDPDTDDDGIPDGEEVNRFGTDPLRADSDGDGLTDGFEVGTSNTDPTREDSDGDGLSDGREVNDTRTDPNDPDMDGDGLSDGDEVDVYGTDPTLRDTDGDRAPDGDEIAAGTDPLRPDTDGDGLSDWDEVVAGTNPLEEDTDGDGLLDGDEVYLYRSNPLSDDTDGDGLLDGYEVEIGTDPASEDSDMDGLSDGDEVDGPTDPRDPDSDDDGLRDGAEVLVHETDPMVADTDGDGLLDGDEVARGLDPLEPDTDGDGLTDGEEVELGLRPGIADTDGDGLLDGAEVALGTDPLLPDTDGDGLLDGAEVDLETDPLLPDSDGGGTWDGDEVLSLGTDPNNADDDLSCVPIAAFPDLPLVEEEAFHPAFVQFGLRGAMLRGALADGAVDAAPRSAEVVVTVFDADRVARCEVKLDTVALAPTDDPWAAGLSAAWYLEPLEGVSGCPALDAEVWGTEDVREVLARVPWGVGLGTVNALEPEARAAAAEAGADYATEWAPYLQALMVTATGERRREHGFGFASVAPCGVLEADAAWLGAGASPGLDAWWDLAPVARFALVPDGGGGVDREPSPSVDTCVEALAAPPFGAGIGAYIGTNGRLADDIDLPAPSCTTFDTAGGDSFIPVTLLPGETLSATYLSRDDGAIYLLSDCADATSCVYGVDAAVDGEPELLEWTNPGDEVTLFLVLDCYSMPCRDYTLDLDIR
ncbi:MAG: hypothetical protein ACI9K2_001908 [Myxococcota bacterium]|jgi:hypothetical protein